MLPQEIKFESTLTAQQPFNVPRCDIDSSVYSLGPSERKWSIFPTSLDTRSTVSNDALAKPSRTKCIKGVQDLLETAGKKNWDGENGDPVTKETVDSALKIIPRIPDLALPDISADPNGNIDFDWLLDNGAMFTISVCGNGEIVVSGLYAGHSKLTGTFWDKDDGDPCLLQCGLNWLNEVRYK